MNNILQTPMDLSAPVKAGRRRFWKQVLPVTEIDYKGTKVNFDKQFHLDLAQSFHKEAFDQVPLVFANADNGHNMDPRNFGGEVLDVQARDSGTWALIEADKEAARAIGKNPRLGVSARIRQGLEKADGRKFGRAIEHVLLTMNPRVTGMEPWQAVDLSDEDADIEVIDLSTTTFEEGNTMGKPSTATKKRGTRKQIDLSALTDEQFNRLLDLAEDVDEEVDENDLEDEDLETDETVDDQGKPVRKKKSKTKITVEEDSEDNGDDGTDSGDEGGGSTDLSDSDRVRLDQFSKMRLDLAEEKWGRDRQAYVNAGVPPFLLDLAEPVLSQPDALTLDLADGDEIDASATIRGMLDGVKGIMDLTDEIGHQVDLSDEAETAEDAFLKSWTENYS